MASEVYFTNLRAKPGVSLLDKLEKLLKRAGIEELDCKDKFTAIKIHFGEPGNMAFIRPNYARRVVDLLEKQGASVFLTDANTLYSGGRSNAVNHLKAATENGFNPMVVKVPVIIADGLKGTEYREMPVRGGEMCKTAKIGSAIAEADVIVSMNHFKGHEMTGFGGALKNLGMGAASVGGKLYLHSDSQPVISTKLCTSCRLCVKYCAHDAVHLNPESKKAEIDYEKCVGCGQCVAVCQFGAAHVVHNSTSETINRKIAEYTLALLDGKPHFHISFIMNVSPECDCWCSNDAAIVPDLGMAASFDPVALDMACADLVMQAPAIEGSIVYDHAGEGERSHRHFAGADKFHHVHPNTDWKSGLVHAQKIGLGNMDYELITV